MRNFCNVKNFSFSFFPAQPSKDSHFDKFQHFDKLSDPTSSVTAADGYFDRFSDPTTGSATCV